jgi:rhomboid protease GluP
VIPERAPEDETAEQGTRVGLPLARPILASILLGIIVLVFLVQSVLSGSTDPNLEVLVFLGAQVNIFVAEGEYWRLVSSMFLHIGLMHLAFNGWALFIFGREVESLYGTLRFAIIYFLSGIAGGLAYYVLGEPAIPSAGASGAIFGIVGAEIAYFLRNRRLFGHLSRQRLGNLAAIVAINLFIGFTVRGINNLAHMGGLLAGLVLGLGLTPTYALHWEGLVPRPRLHNRNSLVTQVVVVGLALVLLAAAVRLGDQRWAQLVTAR